MTGRSESQVAPRRLRMDTGESAWPRIVRTIILILLRDNGCFTPLILAKRQAVIAMRTIIVILIIIAAETAAVAAWPAVALTA